MPSTGNGSRNRRENPPIRIDKRYNNNVPGTEGEAMQIWKQKLIDNEVLDKVKNLKNDPGETINSVLRRMLGLHPLKRGFPKGKKRDGRRGKMTKEVIPRSEEFP